MVPTFTHSGDLGDIIYSLPAIRARGGGRLVLFDMPGRTAHGMTPAKVERLRELLERQPYIESVEWSDGQPDSSLNGFRDHMHHGNLADAHLATQGLDWKERTTAWLTNIKPVRSRPVLFARSARYHNDNFPWRDAVVRYRGCSGFVGTEEEHGAFCRNFGPVPFVRADSLYALAQAIAGSDLFVGNQSCPLAIAHGMRHRLVMEICPHQWAQHHCVFQREGCIIGWDAKIEWPEI